MAGACVLRPVNVWNIQGMEKKQPVNVCQMRERVKNVDH